MRERAAWCVMGVLIIIVGAHQVICPSLYQEIPDDHPREPFASPRLRPLWKVRLIGLAFILVGVLWVYLVLFGKPTDDPVLI